MCLYVGPEVILANLLSVRNGVTLDEIMSYCQRLKEALSARNQSSSVYININAKEVDNALLKYNREFRCFQKQYFINKEINLKHFNARYIESIVSIFTEVAQTMAVESEI